MENSTLLPIVFAFVLYILFVLVPLIPSVVIYRLFPDTKVGASGLLGNLKINSTGAFAAYIIVVSLGAFLVRDIQQLINSSANKKTSWQVEAKVVFKEKDKNGNMIISKDVKDEEVGEKLDIRTTPNYNQKDLQKVIFMTHATNSLPKVTMSYQGFESYFADLNDTNFKINKAARTINLGEVVMTKTDQEYNPENFSEQIKDDAIAYEFINGPPTLKDYRNAE